MKNTNNTIDQTLDQYRNDLGKHFDTYKNHVYRVFSFCQLLDRNPENIEKYAIAAVFHDLGIWTDHTFDYLEPSINRAKEHLSAIGKGEWAEEIALIIDMHHKISRYNGPFESTVETFRRADWIDVTKGRRSFKLTRAEIKKTTKDHPIKGFHRFLVGQTLKQLFKSPFNPLPMFKK